MVRFEGSWGNQGGYRKVAVGAIALAQTHLQLHSAAYHHPLPSWPTLIGLVKSRMQFMGFGLVPGSSVHQGEAPES